MLFSGPKTATSDQGVNAHQIPLGVANLMLDQLGYFGDTIYLLGKSKKLLPRLFTVNTQFITKDFSILRIHNVSGSQSLPSLY